MTQKNKSSSKKEIAEYQHPLERATDFDLESVPWYSSLVVKLFLSFLALALLPMMLSSILTIFAYEQVLNKYVPESELTALTDHINLQLFLSILFITILAIFIAVILSRNISRPIKILTYTVKRISAGDLNTRITVKRKDEFGNLAQFLNVMVSKLREIQERTLTISKLKSQFVSVAAHQLRTPLSAVKWTLRLLLDGDMGSLSPDQKEFLERGYITNEHMINLVNDLLNVSRIEEGKYGFTFAEVDIGAIISKVIDDLSLAAKQRHITIEFRRLVEDKLLIYGDNDRLGTALTNLLDNAIRYSHPEKTIIVSLQHAKRSRGVDDDSGMVEITIQDNGIGIPDDEVDKVFLRFYRASNAIREQTDGSGLGLFIAQNIIQRHGGDVWFESKEGMGTTFFVLLPLHKEEVPQQQSSFDDFVKNM